MFLKLINKVINKAYAGLRHTRVLSTKPRFGATCSLNTKLRLGGENKSVT